MIETIKLSGKVVTEVTEQVSESRFKVLLVAISTVREKVIWAPADFFFPLKKKWSVYNFNSKFIWTVTDRTITEKNPEKCISKTL